MTNVGTNKSVISRSGVASMTTDWRFETALVNRKSVNGSNRETARSTSLGATQLPNPPATSRAPIAGKTHSAARTVPLTAQAHQNEAKLRSNIAAAHTVPPCTSTNMEGDPNRSSTSIGSNTEQTSPANKAVHSLMSHWRRADTGRVMCQECIPDDLSSPSDRAPARTAINGVTAITTAT